MPLYIVSVPIGNPDDITLRAVKTLQAVDFVICEEIKIGRKLLKQLDIEKPLVYINEHDEIESSDAVIQRLLKNQSAAYFSDAGTPLFADPGTYLVKRCHDLGIRVVPVPGASSLTAALAVAGVDIRQFYFAGFLPRVSIERRAALRNLKQFHCPVILYDTPYRLLTLLADIHLEFSPDTQIVLLLALTQPDERILKGTIADIISTVKKNYSKREFVLIIELAGKSQPKGRTGGGSKRQPYKRRSGKS
ncbi:16S rRNA (cytidine(1402)-2'-O)-methyltransferase [bacterium]|nr:16S rRNA (cytidine(1402)-2'-O)-methyltransferase [bacterium]